MGVGLEGLMCLIPDYIVQNALTPSNYSREGRCPSRASRQELFMKRALNLFLGLAVFGPLFFSTASSSKAYGEAADETIVSRTAEIDGIKLHYMTAGHGTPLILFHGRSQIATEEMTTFAASADRTYH